MRILQCAVFPGALACIAWGQGRAPLGNDDVVKLVRAGFGEAVLLEAIEVNETGFDTSPQALLGLKEARVSERVMSAMLSKAQAQKPAGKPDLERLEPGVYVRTKDGYMPLEPEILSCCTRLGMSTSPVHLLAEALSPHSRTVVPSSAEFLIVCAPEVANCDYQLLRAGPRVRRAAWGWKEEEAVRVFGVRASIDRGELLSLEGFRWDAKVISPRLSFEQEKLSDRAFRIRPPELAKGEYGFLPLPPPGEENVAPGLVRRGTSQPRKPARPREKNVTPVGRIYTFSVP